VIVLTFIFYIFLKKLMMCHMVIGGYKRGVIRMDLIVGALLILFNFSFFSGIC
jgi:hypothetical protein